MSTTAILPGEEPLDSGVPVSQPDEIVDWENWQPNPDLFPWNEDMPKELQDCVVKLGRFVCDEFKYPRRLEVMSAWRCRSYWREMQHLSWNWEGDCWDVLGPAGYDHSSASSNRDSAVLYTTNIFQEFGKAFIAVITRAVPGIRFEPEDVNEAADLDTAEAAEDLKKLVQHENDPIQLMTRAAYYGYTDGRVHGWTRWEVDKRTGKPRETQSMYGSMEVKVPVIYECMEEYPYLQFSYEYHLSTVRDKVKKRKFTDPDYWKKIKGGSSGNGQDIYERTARISVKQGISMKSAGGDAYSHLVTTQRTWFRPSIFLEDDVEEKYQQRLQSLFPNGLYLEVDNGTYTGCRDANMDDEWAVENIMEGDGSFRNAEGTCLVSVQERTNDIINMTQDMYEKGQPAGHFNEKIWDIDKMNKQGSMPAAKYGVNMSDAELPPGTNLASQAFFEPAATVSADQLEYLKELMTDIPERLTGISAILWGSDTSGDKSGKALSIQQAAAMGLIGQPFKVLRRLYARMMEQAVRCAARNRKDDFAMGIPDMNGQVETVQVRIEQLSGKVRCYPIADENYPDDFISKRNMYMQLLQEAAADPVMKAILAAPENQMFAKRVLGLEELTIPDAQSWAKQMVEINFMLQMPPKPAQLQPPQEVPNPAAPEIIETIQPPPIPPRSSLPIDADYDNHAAELLTLTIWVNSPKGQKAKKSDPVGFQNVRLHGLEHKTELMKAMAAQAPPPAPATSQPHPPAHHATAPAAPGGAAGKAGAPPAAPPAAA